MKSFITKVIFSVAIFIAVLPIPKVEDIATMTSSVIFSSGILSTKSEMEFSSIDTPPQDT